MTHAGPAIGREAAAEAMAVMMSSNVMMNVMMSSNRLGSDRSACRHDMNRHQQGGRHFSASLLCIAASGPARDLRVGAVCLEISASLQWTILIARNSY